MRMSGAPPRVAGDHQALRGDACGVRLDRDAVHDPRRAQSPGSGPAQPACPRPRPRPDLPVSRGEAPGTARMPPDPRGADAAGADGRVDPEGPAPPRGRAPGVGTGPAAA